MTTHCIERILEGSGYSKHDNATYRVIHSPGDENWNAISYALCKVRNDGELSTAKNRLAHWPLLTFTNRRFVKMASDSHNREHAGIEIIDNHPG